MNNYANQFYNQYGAPAVAQTTTNLYQQGMNNSSAGGAEIGQEAAQGHALAGLAGTQAYEQLLSGLYGGRNSYFGGPGQLGLGSVNSSNQYQNQLYGTASENYRAQLGLGQGLATAGLSNAVGAQGNMLGTKGKFGH